VCVIGAGSDVGRIASLFLKQSKVIKILAMYDDDPERLVMGVANDLAHIDTSTEVEAYQGRVFLKSALYDSDVVLICGGCYSMPPCCFTQDRDLFFANMQFVRTITLACAQFCPQAILAIQTPPSLKLARVYDARRLLGVNAINAMRANQLFCSITGSDPRGASVPVICGTGRCTRQFFCIIALGMNPEWNNSEASSLSWFLKVSSYLAIPMLTLLFQTQAECLTRLVREADDIICKVKSNNEQGHLSIGFSTARFVVNLMKEQKDPEKCFGMEICATAVTVGKGGISEYAIPDLSGSEKKLLEYSKCDLEDMLNLGRCYALGDEYYLHPCKVCTCCSPPCKVCKPCEVCKPCNTKKNN
ncbi:putative malate dehydrogenase, partial [Operophtera brumata]